MHYMEEHLGKLVGGVITGLIRDDHSDSEWEQFWGLQVSKGQQKYHVWIQCDPEGNGPVHLEIENP